MNFTLKTSQSMHCIILVTIGIFFGSRLLAMEGSKQNKRIRAGQRKRQRDLRLKLKEAEIQNAHLRDQIQKNVAAKNERDQKILEAAQQVEGDNQQVEGNEAQNDAPPVAPGGPMLSNNEQHNDPNLPAAKKELDQIILEPSQQIEGSKQDDVPPASPELPVGPIQADAHHVGKQIPQQDRDLLQVQAGIDAAQAAQPCNDAPAKSLGKDAPKDTDDISFLLQRVRVNRKKQTKNTPPKQQNVGKQEPQGEGCSSDNNLIAEAQTIQHLPNHSSAASYAAAAAQYYKDVNTPKSDHRDVQMVQVSHASKKQEDAHGKQEGQKVTPEVEYDNKTSKNMPRHMQCQQIMLHGNHMVTEALQNWILLHQHQELQRLPIHASADSCAAAAVQYYNNSNKMPAKKVDAPLSIDKSDHRELQMVQVPPANKKQENAIPKQEGQKVTPEDAHDQKTLDTALLGAITEGNLARVQSLLQSKANPNALDGLGNPPLLWAIDSLDPAIVKALLVAGANPNGYYNVLDQAQIASDDGKKIIKHPLLLAAITTKNVGIVKLLLDHKADPNALNGYGYSLIAQAIYLLDPAIVEAMLVAGADPRLLKYRSQQVIDMLSKSPAFNNWVAANQANGRYKACARCKIDEGKACCSKCNNRYYCSKDCQKADWKEHKKNCRNQNG